MRCTGIVLFHIPKRYTSGLYYCRDSMICSDRFYDLAGDRGWDEHVWRLETGGRLRKRSVMACVAPRPPGINAGSNRPAIDNTDTACRQTRTFANSVGELASEEIP